MKFPLGAMTVGDILDRGLKLLFARLPVFFAINLIVLTPVILLQVAIPFVVQGGNQFDQKTLIAMAGAGLFALLLTLILQPIGTAAILYIVMEEYAGRKPSMGEAFSFALTRFMTLIGASIVVGLIVAVGFVLCCVPGIYFAVSYAFIAQVVVLEKLGVGEAMSRSQKLVKGFFGRVFGVLLLIGAANIAIQMALQFGLAAVLPPQEIVPAGQGVQVKVNAMNQVIDTLITQLVSIVFSTYMAVCTTLLYLDLRIRKEGFDLELAAQLGEEADARDEADGEEDDRPRRRRRRDESDDEDDDRDRRKPRRRDDDF